MECPICAQGDKGLDVIAFERSSKTAHSLAMAEATKVYATNQMFTLPELYRLYYDRIYEHEYARNLWVERERRSHRLRKAYPMALCDYHGEFEDAFCEKVYKETERNYAKSKWPNPLRN